VYSNISLTYTSTRFAIKYKMGNTLLQTPPTVKQLKDFFKYIAHNSSGQMGIKQNQPQAT
jgi:hypothetical protein